MAVKLKFTREIAPRQIKVVDEPYLKTGQISATLDLYRLRHQPYRLATCLDNLTYTGYVVSRYECERPGAAGPDPVVLAHEHPRNLEAHEQTNVQYQSHQYKSLVKRVAAQRTYQEQHSHGFVLMMQVVAGAYQKQVSSLHDPVGDVALQPTPSTRWQRWNQYFRGGTVTHADLMSVAMQGNPAEVMILKQYLEGQLAEGFVAPDNTVIAIPGGPLAAESLQEAGNTSEGEKLAILCRAALRPKKYRRRTLALCGVGLVAAILSFPPLGLGMGGMLIAAALGGFITQQFDGFITQQFDGVSLTSIFKGLLAAVGIFALVFVPMALMALMAGNPLTLAIGAGGFMAWMTFIGITTTVLKKSYGARPGSESAYQNMVTRRDGVASPKAGGSTMARLAEQAKGMQSKLLDKVLDNRVGRFFGYESGPAQSMQIFTTPDSTPEKPVSEPMPTQVGYAREFMGLAALPVSNAEDKNAPSPWPGESLYVGKNNSGRRHAVIEQLRQEQASRFHRSMSPPGAMRDPGAIESSRLSWCESPLPLSSEGSRESLRIKRDNSGSSLRRRH